MVLGAEPTCSDRDAIVCNRIGCRQPFLLPTMSDRRVSLLRTVNKTDLQVEKIAKRQHGLVAWRQLERLRITRHQIPRRVRTGPGGRGVAGGGGGWSGAGQS